MLRRTLQWTSSLLCARLALPALAGMLACGSDDPLNPRAPAIASVVVTTPASTLSAIGQTLQLEAVAKDANGAVIPDASIAWESSAPQFMLVTSSGLATAVANGTATMTASAGTKSGVVNIGLLQAVASVTLEPSSWTATRVGERKPFVGTAKDANGHPVAAAELVWTSTNPGLVSVDSKGLATARDAGDAKLSARVAMDSAVATYDMPELAPDADSVMYTVFVARGDSSHVVLQNGRLLFATENHNTYATRFTPQSPWSGASTIDRFAWSRDELAVITDAASEGGPGTLWLKDRTSDWALAGIGSVADVKIEAGRIVWLLSNGDLRAKENTQGAVTDLASGVRAFELAGDRIAALQEDGDLRVKEGSLHAPWVTVTSGIAQFRIAGPYIGTLEANGRFRAKADLHDPWTVMADAGVTDFRVSSSLVGMIAADGSFQVREGLSGSWATLASSGVQQFELEGDRIVWLLTSGQVRAKVGPNGPVTDIRGGVRQISLQGDFIGLLDAAGELSIKRGINGPRVVAGTYPSLRQYRLFVVVPTPPTRTTVDSYRSGRTACSAESDRCFSPHETAVPVPHYGRFCGAGIPSDANLSWARQEGPLDGMDQLCRHHDSAALWYPDNRGTFDACVVKYGLVHARLTRRGSLLTEGTAAWTSAWARMPQLRDVVAAYEEWTSACSPSQLQEFSAATAARR